MNDLVFLGLIVTMMILSAGILYIAKAPLLWIVTCGFACYFFLTGVYIDIQVAIWWIPYRAEHMTYLTAIWSFIFIPLTAEPLIIYLIARRYQTLEKKVSLLWTAVFVVGEYFFWVAMEDQLCKLLACNVLEWTAFQVEYYLIGIPLITIALFANHRKDRKEREKQEHRISKTTLLLLLPVTLGLTVLLLLMAGALSDFGTTLYTLAFENYVPGISVEGWIIMLTFGVLLFWIGLLALINSRKAPALLFFIAGIDFGFLLYATLVGLQLHL